MTQERSSEGSGSSLVKHAHILIFVPLVLWLAYCLKGLLVSVIVALVLASAIAPLAEMLEKKRIPRLATVLGVYGIVVALYIALASYVFPAIWDQAVQLFEQVPTYVPKLTRWYDQLTDIAGRTATVINEGGPIPPPGTSAPSAGAHPVDTEDVQNMVLKFLRQTLELSAGLVGMVLNSVLVLFLAAYFIVEADVIWPKLLRWIPPRYRDRAASLIRPLQARMGGYVRGQIMVSLAVGTFLAIGLTLLGVRYSFVLGIMAGVLNLMPFVGSLLTATFAILVASNQSLMLGGLTLGLFALEQWVESNLIVPTLLGSQVELHPILVLFAILIGATLMGVVGALIAVPVAAAAFLLAEEFYVKPINETPPAS